LIGSNDVTHTERYEAIDVERDPEPGRCEARQSSWVAEISTDPAILTTNVDFINIISRRLVKYLE